MNILSLVLANAHLDNIVEVILEEGRNLEIRRLGISTQAN